MKNNKNLLLTDLKVIYIRFKYITFIYIYVCILIFLTQQKKFKTFIEN